MANARLSSFLTAGITGGASTKRIVTNFAEENGLVYFGYVSQRSDDHHIVRGMTVSTKHTDNHYCIGTFDGYDVVFVERHDTLRDGKKHQWHILEIDLKTARDLPHCFIGSGKHGHGFHELLSVKYPTLQPATLGHTAVYPAQFVNAFTVYCGPAHVLQIERLLPPDMTLTLGSHFKGLVMEISNDTLYVYSESSHITPTLLTTMLKNGVWLAEHLDKNSRLL